MGCALLRRLSTVTGHVKVMAEDEWAHIVLLAALSFTDDTALLKKSIVPELLVCAAAATCPGQATIPDHVWTHI